MVDELEQYKASFPTCDKHRPTSGARSGCLICAMIENNYCISIIDYLCGAPNEMGLSRYDTECDPRAVVDRVRAKLVAPNREEVERLLDQLLMADRNYRSSTTTNERVECNRQFEDAKRRLYSLACHK